MNNKSTFEILGWDEEPYFEAAGSAAKLKRAAVTKRFSGAIEGDAKLNYLMAYSPTGDATFVGLERVEGGLDGRRGTFVLRHVGGLRGRHRERRSRSGRRVRDRRSGRSAGNGFVLSRARGRIRDDPRL